MTKKWAKYYSLYRPNYALDAINKIIQLAALKQGGIVADVGSGTGILSKQLLDRSFKVFGIEPENLLKSIAESNLNTYSNFISITGSAEHTELQNDSVNLIVVGSAFHWFDKQLSLNEFKRILKTGGYCAILENKRIDKNPFMVAFSGIIDKFRRYSSEHLFGQIRLTQNQVEVFFNEFGFEYFEFANDFTLDYKQIEGKLFSISHLPKAGSIELDDMLNELKYTFSLFQVDDKVLFTYKTKLFIGRLN